MFKYRNEINQRYNKYFLKIKLSSLYIIYRIFKIEVRIYNCKKKKLY